MKTIDFRKAVSEIGTQENTKEAAKIADKRNVTPDQIIESIGEMGKVIFDHLMALEKLGQPRVIQPEDLMAAKLSKAYVDEPFRMLNSSGFYTTYNFANLLSLYDDPETIDKLLEVMLENNRNTMECKDDK